MNGVFVSAPLPPIFLIIITALCDFSEREGSQLKVKLSSKCNQGLFVIEYE